MNDAQAIVMSALERVAETLDIPDHIHDDAVLKYEDAGEWLAAEGSELRGYSPAIYPQGSFRLGTVVKPLGWAGAFDIDLVCRLDIRKESVSQEELKAMVGRRLKASPELGELVSESRRCWTVDWSSVFHMDVLPAIPNEETQPDGILLTDTKLTRWQKSNPILYAEWFRERMRVIQMEKWAALAKSIGASIEEVPEWRVKTPLQRAIQIVKRHRDIAFASREDVRPASIIITTLAAKAYANQADLAQALMTIVDGMPSHIQKRDGKYFVLNPVDSGENFADKWNEDAMRAEAFMAWVESARADFGALTSPVIDLKKASPLLERSLGRDVTGPVVKLAEERLAKGAAWTPSFGLVVPALGTSSHAEAPPWRILGTRNAHIRGWVHRKNKGKRLWDLSDSPQQKGLSIRFAVTTDTPPPFDVYWQVVNTGDEAAASGDLRGRMVKGDSGTTTRWEGTKYRGTHWVEGFVVKDGLCVARTGRKLVKVR